MMTRHALQRCQERGLRTLFVQTILDHADVDEAAGDNCRRLRVSAKRARHLNIDDSLARYALIWSDDSARVVTVLPITRRARSSQNVRRNRGVRRRG